MGKDKETDLRNRRKAVRVFGAIHKELYFSGNRRIN
jgi:hypothetical protein